MTEMDMQSRHVAPELEADAFNCPFCGAYAQMTWFDLPSMKEADADHVAILYQAAECTHCRKKSIWRVAFGGPEQMVRRMQELGEPMDSQLIYPDTGFAPWPSEEMPDAAKADYEEAARILARSPRAAAALLRLAVQKLCVHLGQKGKNIRSDLEALAGTGVLPAGIVDALEALRVEGGAATHPGTLSEADHDEAVVARLFDLVNFIVDKAIGEPRRLAALRG